VWHVYKGNNLRQSPQLLNYSAVLTNSMAKKMVLGLIRNHNKYM